MWKVLNQALKCDVSFDCSVDRRQGEGQREGLGGGHGNPGKSGGENLEAWLRARAAESAKQAGLRTPRMGSKTHNYLGK